MYPASALGLRVGTRLQVVGDAACAHQQVSGPPRVGMQPCSVTTACRARRNDRQTEQVAAAVVLLDLPISLPFLVGRELDQLDIASGEVHIISDGSVSRGPATAY